MSGQQLFCVANDSHRAVLLAGALSDMGYPVVQLHEPSERVEDPALVLWTRRAANTDWIRELLLRHPQTVALVIDDVPLPVACKRAVALQRWPARSADANISALVNWLHNPAASELPFVRKPPAPPARDPGSGVALTVLAVIVAVLLGLLLTSGEEENITAAATKVEAAGVRESAREVTVAAASGSAPVQTVTVPGPDQAATAHVDRPAVHVEPAAGVGSTSIIADSRPVLMTAPVPATVPASVAEEAVTGEPDPIHVVTGNDSLSHLCRAQSLAAAVAWYRVLTPAQKRRAPELECVQRLLQRPGFEQLREEIQA